MVEWFEMVVSRVEMMAELTNLGSRLAWKTAHLILKELGLEWSLEMMTAVMKVVLIYLGSRLVEMSAN